MQLKRNIRVSDTVDLLSDKNSGFYIRKRTPLQLLFFLIATSSVVVLGTYAIVYFNSKTGVALCLGIGAPLFLIGRQMENLKKLLHVGEFMNALFSSIISKKHRFILIIRNDGAIVFFNKQFQELFPESIVQPERTIKGLLTAYNVSTEHQDALLAALEKGEEARVGVIIGSGANKSPEPVSITIEPIDRPSGFLLVRGQ